MVYTVYHTTENRGNHADIVASGGIYSDKTDLFLGKGYYYWEGNFPKAKEWGEKHYRGNYYIFLGKISFDLEKMFDLSTNEHLRYIETMQRRLKRRDLKVGMFIDYLRDRQAEELSKGNITADQLFFPFLYAKAIDNTLKIHINDLEAFSIRVGQYYNLHPEVFFCVYDKKDITLTNFEKIREIGSVQK